MRTTRAWLAGSVPAMKLSREELAHVEALIGQAKASVMAQQPRGQKPRSYAELLALRRSLLGKPGG